ncbi:transporter [Flavobacterium aquidurense]|nr:transporter [Flavobacterium aquidurense]
MNKLYATLIFLMTIQMAVSQNATEAKIYQNYPIGMQMLQGGYLLQTTNSTIDGAITIPNRDIDINAHIGYVRYANFFNLAGKTAGVQVMLPYVNIDADILGYNANKSGMGDIMVVLGTNIIGGDALSFPQFLQTKKQLALAWSLAVTMPTGSYSDSQLLNPGGNRWQFKPEIALTVPVDNWDFEAYLNAKFFTRNNALPNLLPSGTPSKLEQKAFYGLTLHAVYNFNQKFWISADAAGRVGGETKKDGIAQEDSQSVAGVGGTFNYSPSLFHQFGINYITAAGGNDYAPNGSLFTVKYTYVFGGGMKKTMQALKNQNQNNQ